MNRICIGIHVHSEPARLRATLASLRTTTSQRVELKLLPDGPDLATGPALSLLRDLPQLGTAEPLGTPACFNRLAASTDADILVLLESGALVGPHWLDYLLSALAADPHNGLAGPSTNRAWNEQCVFPHSGSTPAEIELTAKEAVRRFGDTWCTLEPLHSLADFCYVVRREVVESIGAADEGYGLGPCWEMDYNIRAARAGFRGVWARASYVYRPPFTARRRREEVLRFESSKHHYQDKFCALHLRGERADYEYHCRGEECEHFAPASLIRICMPLVETVKREAKTGKSIFESKEQIPQQIQGCLEPKAKSEEFTLKTEDLPLVSCIMPTYNRRLFVPQAIEYFLRQDYHNRELIIVDDGTDPIKDLVPQDKRIRYIRQEHKITIGAKRNLACKEARGEIIVHWDDDDWMADWRLSYQVRSLLSEQADLCGLDTLLHYDLKAGQGWQYFYSKRDKPWVSGNTLCYTKTFWISNPFSDIDVGEDTRFVWSNRPKKIVVLQDSTFYIALIHSGNISPKRVSDNHWRCHSTAEIQRVMGKDWAFYADLSQAKKQHGYHHTEVSVTHTGISSDIPLVSCIMPTYNRRYFVRFALDYFLQQDYPNKELVIIDDGTDAIGDLAKDIADVRYVRLVARHSIGAKRNMACSQARGELIAHWDDDDWYAPNRLRYQVEPIIAGQADMTGLQSSFLLTLPDGEFWTSSQKLHSRMFVGDVHGGTLMYRKALWEKGMRYPEVNLAEDAALVKQVLNNGKQLLCLANDGVFVYIRHSHNAWRFEPGLFLEPSGWKRISRPSFFPAIALSSYQNNAWLGGSALKKS